MKRITALLLAALLAASLAACASPPPREAAPAESTADTGPASARDKNVGFKQPNAGFGSQEPDTAAEPAAQEETAAPAKAEPAAAHWFPGMWQYDKYHSGVIAAEDGTIEFYGNGKVVRTGIWEATGSNTVAACTNDTNGELYSTRYTLQSNGSIVDSEGDSLSPASSWRVDTESASSSSSAKAITLPAIAGASYGVSASSVPSTLDLACSGSSHTRAYADSGIESRVIIDNGYASSDTYTTMEDGTTYHEHKENVLHAHNNPNLPFYANRDMSGTWAFVGVFVGKDYYSKPKLREMGLDYAISFDSATTDYDSHGEKGPFTMCVYSNGKSEIIDSNWYYTDHGMEMDGGRFTATCAEDYEIYLYIRPAGSNVTFFLARTSYTGD